MHHDAARHQPVQRPRDRAGNGDTEGEKALSEQEVLSEHLEEDACDCPAAVAKGETWKNLGGRRQAPLSLSSRRDSV